MIWKCLMQDIPSVLERYRDLHKHKFLGYFIEIYFKKKCQKVSCTKIIAYTIYDHNKFINLYEGC